jgi:hypothetical protein
MEGIFLDISYRHTETLESERERERESIGIPAIHPGESY